MRALILEADSEMIEEWKWSNPVWSHHGIVCTGEAYTKVVKLTFARGASIPDPSRLFNSSLAGNTRRALDIHEGEKVDADAFKALVKTAVARNGPPAKKAKPVKLLTGGNPQIAKADAHAPVQAYIAAMPGWKRDVGRRLNKPTSIPFNPQSDQERKLSDLCKLRKNWLRLEVLADARSSKNQTAYVGLIEGASSRGGH